MHPHVTAVLQGLDEARATLQRAVDAIPAARRTLHPGLDRWSVVEVLEHISLVESAFVQRLGAAVTGALATGLGAEGAERTPLPNSIAAMLRDRSTPREAADPVKPTGRLDPETAWTAVERTSNQLRAVVTQADGFALSAVTLTHPFFGSLTAYQWIELIAAHRERHAMQIREIAAQVVARS